MSTNQSFFRVTSVARVDARNIRISGDLILKGEFKESVSWEISASPSDTTNKPPTRLSLLDGHFDPDKDKRIWILPQRNSEFYARVKHYAEEIGYETVEQDDTSYPR
jgi:hypothetical protein